MKLEGRVAIVTGGAHGIGRAIVEKLSAEGATVVIADINGEAAAAVASAVPNASSVQTDVSDEASVKALVAAVLAQHGRIDVLVNDAAIVPYMEWDDIDFAEWRRIMAVNLDGVFLTVRHVSDAMRTAGYGRIVNICSNVILAGTPNLAHYAASKGGVFGFTRVLATELGKYGITVNGVAPGLTATDTVLKGKFADSFDFVQMLQSLPRRGQPEDIAPAVAFLASEEAGWITGQLLVADGGHTRS
jgi:NAD(P)-dependent dehydrogenase (short-subunit alcohol dehydrogenase family)